MNHIIEELEKIGIVPVVTIDDGERAVPVAKALAAGGIPCTEITFRTDCAIESISRIKQEAPEILLGAGTVLTIDQADQAVEAGAEFIVAPGFNPKVVDHCLAKGVTCIPGCSNPSDIEMALERGLSVIKFSPAEQAGGLAYLKAVSAPYPQMRFMPSGGINAGNIGAYTSFEKTAMCGGSWIVPPDVIKRGDYEKITALSQEAVFSMLGFSLAHVGINAENESEAFAYAKLFETMFGFFCRPAVPSFYAGTGIEIMKSPYHGKHGHIGIAVNSVTKGKAFLERMGFLFDPDSAKKDDDGNLRLIYLKDEIAGFSVHLTLDV